MKTIVHIDDDQDDCMLFEEALTAINVDYLCKSFCKPSEALDALVTGQLHPDYIFLDYNMPLMTGLDFLKQFYRHNQSLQIPIIMLTTSASVELMQSCLQMGANDFAQKPATFPELRQLINRILSNK